MVLTKGQYAELVEKLASEIVEDGEEKEKEKDEEEEMTQEEAQAMAEKAAFVYQNGLNKIAMAQEVYAEGFGAKTECIETLASAGLLDIDGFNKEAAEADEETYEITCKLAEIHDEAIQKMAEAEEVYNESVMEVTAAAEVLEYFGIDTESL